MTDCVTCSFLGLGLIGGSLAKAIRERIPHVRILVFDTDTATLTAARESELAQETYDTIDPRLCQCDYLFLCAPVSQNLRNLELIAPMLSSDCIVSDVSSVKKHIHQKIRSLGLDSQFIGGHPMTGSERYGFLNSAASLLENAYYILTPGDSVPRGKVTAMYAFIEALGAVPFLMDAQNHDRTTAAISHLPHLVASSLVNLVRMGDDEHHTFRTLAAGGFKDITRIASSSPGLWQQICLENSGHILDFLTEYINYLQEIRQLLSDKNLEYLYRFFEEARDYRDSFIETKSGPLMKQYVLTLDIPDKAGALATVVNLLADQNISIKNIGIVHNREYQAGVLRMEFYHAQDCQKAAAFLTAHEYTMYPA